MKKKEERLKHLIEILQNKSGATIRELASILDVSEMTIRRDLEILKEKNIVLNLNGAAIYNTKNKFQNEDEGYSLSLATQSHVKEKTKIGQYAASLIQEDDCIIIDNGSTVEYLAENISNDIKLTVLTCNLNILNRIYSNPNISIVFGGGYFHPDTALFESPESISLIEKTRATKVFLSAAGVHENLGATCMNNYEIETKKTIIKSGAEKILLVDSSKFSMIKPCFFAELISFDRIITDKNISEEWINLIKEKGINLDIV